MSQAVVISAFVRSIYAVVQSAEKASITMAQKMRALIDAQYGAICPTFEQYRDDQKALAALAATRGLVDNQWVRKPYAAAIKSRYGALPVSQAPEAVLKAAKRAADKAAAQGQTPAKAGAPKGETTERVPSAEESIESIVTRLGLFRCLDACIAILATDKSTAAQAKHLQAQARKAAELAAAAAPVAPVEPAKVEALAAALAPAKAARNRKAA